MTHGEARLPVLVQQVVVQSLHRLQFVCLIESSGLVQTGIGGIGSSNRIVESAILIGVKHLRTGHLVGETERTTVADAGRAHLTLLGGHQNDTVSSAGTIDGSRSILQH